MIDGTLEGQQIITIWEDIASKIISRELRFQELMSQNARQFDILEVKRSAQ